MFSGVMIRLLSFLLVALTVPVLLVSSSYAQPVADLAEFDRSMKEVMAKWDIPGASLAVAYKGKLLFAKGYGLADRVKALPVTPQTLFRVGSINKVVTAVAILRLVEAGKLVLDAPALPLLQRLDLLPERLGDVRSRVITIRHLLEHSAGFDRAISGDPFFQPYLMGVASRQHIAPVTSEAMVRDSLERPLDFYPGKRYAYANVGYCMLGKIVEAISGRQYGDFVGQEILLPVIGKGFLAGKSTVAAPGETRYYPYPGEPEMLPAPGISVAQVVPTPYGSYSLESMEALGAWIATPSDVLRFMLAIDGARSPRLLSDSSLRAMRSPPSYLAGSGAAPERYYGLGVSVLRSGNTENWWHDGSQPGVMTLALRSSTGWAWVVAFNSRPKEKSIPAFFSDFDGALWRAARASAVGGRYRGRSAEPKKFKGEPQN